MMTIIMIIKTILKNVIMRTIIVLRKLLLSFIIYHYTFMMCIIIMLELLKVFVNIIMI